MRSIFLEYKFMANLNVDELLLPDHRINYTIYNLAAFMEGDIQDCIDHLIVAENTERMKESEL